MSITEKKQTKKRKPIPTLKKVIRKAVEEESVNLRVEEPKVRYLKLNTFYRQSQSRSIYRAQPKIVPELRLCGNWLEAAGFLPENYVSVTIMDGLLIVRLTDVIENK